MKKSQADRLFDLLKDGQPHSTLEILEQVYGGSHLGLARCAARIFDLKKRGKQIEGWKDKENPSLYWYQLKNPPKKLEVRFEMRNGQMTAVL